MNLKAIYRTGLGPFRLAGDTRAWGLEITDSELRAVKARFHDGELIIDAIDRIDFSSIVHDVPPKRAVLIEEAVNLFKERNPINNSDKVIVSLSGKMILSRFFTLPPIKKSKITETLKYELRKQVPFDPNEIVWDYQQFEDDSMVEKEVKIGLFATKKENIYDLLPCLTPIRANLDAIQITPVAIYNLVHLSSDSDEDVIVINVEKGNTDFIVVGRSKYWNRSIPISEVNVALIREIQRSIGYYVSVSKGIKPKVLYLMGEVFEDDSKIKFIDDNLENQVRFLDLLDKISMLNGLDHPALTKKKIYGFETALGLAIQGLGLGEIKINLLPLDYVKARQVSRQKILVCVIAISIFLSLFTQSIKDYTTWRSLTNGVNTVTETFDKVRNLESVYKDIEKKVKAEEENLRKWESIGAQNSFWIETIDKIIDTIPEKVYLSSIESLWGFPATDKISRVSSKGFFEKTEKNIAKNTGLSKEVLILSIKGESCAPEISYIEERVKGPLRDMVLSGRKEPVFSDVRLVQGTVRHVKIMGNKDVSEENVDGINHQPISFEIQCIVNAVN